MLHIDKYKALQLFFSLAHFDYIFIKDLTTIIKLNTYHNTYMGNDYWVQQA